MRRRRGRRDRRDVKRDPVAQARMGRAWHSRAARARRDPRLSATEANIYAELCTRTYLGYGDGRVGCKVLAAAVNRCTRTVRRSLAHLEALGYVVIGERQARHGGPAVNTYRPVTPKDWSAAGVERRREARRARDEARKRRGGVLTRKARALTRARVNVPSETGRTPGRPPVPGGERTLRAADWPDWLEAGWRRAMRGVYERREEPDERDREVGARILELSQRTARSYEDAESLAMVLWQADFDKRGIGQ